MPGPKDTTLDVRTSADGSLTADETVTGTFDGGIHTKTPLALHVVFPQDLAEASDTVKVTFKFTDSGKKLEVTHTDALVTAGDTFPFELVLPVPPSDSEGYSVVFDITDDDSGGDFDAGEVLAWFELEHVKPKVPSTP